MLDCQILIYSDAAVAHRRLCKQTDLHDRIDRQMEVAHHVEVFAVYGIMESKIVTHAADLQPGGVAFKITSVCIVGIALGDNADSCMGAKVCQFIAALCLPTRPRS